MHDQLHAGRRRRAVAHGVHVAEFPGGIDVEQRKWRRAGEERLAREMQQDGGILAGGIEHDRPFRARDRGAQDVDALRLQRLELGHRARSHAAMLCAGTASVRATWPTITVTGAPAGRRASSAASAEIGAATWRCSARATLATASAGVAGSRPGGDGFAREGGKRLARHVDHRGRLRVGDRGPIEVARQLPVGAVAGHELDRGARGRARSARCRATRPPPAPR